MINVSLIIPIYNCLNYTIKCLNDLEDPLSLIDKTVNKLNIVVVDDGSTDGSHEWIKENYPEVLLCKGDGNLWWSGGINMGIRYALSELKSEYFLLWNNDVRPARYYFTNLFKILAKNNTNEIILSKVYIENKNNDELILSSLGGTFDPVTGKLSLLGFGKPESSFNDPKEEIKWFPGMGTIIHKSVFEKIGYFDEKYFPQYKGDADYGIRAYNAGYKLVVYHELQIWNDRSNTGFSNDRSIIDFIRSLFSRKSNSNIYRDYLFYKRHGESLRVYFELFRKYFMHIGGFFKWKFLGFFGINRNRRF